MTSPKAQEVQKKVSTPQASSNPLQKGQAAKPLRPQRLIKGHKHSNSEVVFLRPEPEAQQQQQQPRIEKKRLLTPKVLSLLTVEKNKIEIIKRNNKKS